MSKVNVVVIDRSEIFKAGVLQKLSREPDFRLTDCHPDDEPLMFIEANSADVVLLDIDSPVSRGLQLARAITRFYPNTRVILLSSYFSDEELFEAIKTGAAAYLDKRTNIEGLSNVIKEVSSGQYLINDYLVARPAIAERVLRQFQKISSMGLVKEKVAAPLTEREIQVLNYIAGGSTNKEVAQVLGLSEQTIKNHVRAILRKLNTNDRAHMVALALSNQWISLTER